MKYYEGNSLYILEADSGEGMREVLLKACEEHKRKMAYQALEDALLQGRQLRIVIEYTLEGKVDVTVDDGAWSVFSDLNFLSLEEALAAAETGVRKYYETVEKLCA